MVPVRVRVPPGALQNLRKRSSSGQGSGRAPPSGVVSVALRVGTVRVRLAEADTHSRKARCAQPRGGSRGPDGVVLSDDLSGGWQGTPTGAAPTAMPTPSSVRRVLGRGVVAASASRRSSSRSPSSAASSISWSAAVVLPRSASRRSSARSPSSPASWISSSAASELPMSASRRSSVTSPRSAANSTSSSTASRSPLSARSRSSDQVGFGHDGQPSSVVESAIARCWAYHRRGRAAFPMPEARSRWACHSSRQRGQSLAEELGERDHFRQRGATFRRSVAQQRQALRGIARRARHGWRNQSSAAAGSPGPGSPGPPARPRRGSAALSGSPRAVSPRR